MLCGQGEGGDRLTARGPVCYLLISADCDHQHEFEPSSHAALRDGNGRPEARRVVFRDPEGWLLRVLVVGQSAKGQYGLVVISTGGTR